VKHSEDDNRQGIAKQVAESIRRAQRAEAQRQKEARAAEKASRRK
jgi:hypothetical protein